MIKPSSAGFLGGVSCLLFASLSHAQCSKDTDCKGTRVCEEGTCVEPKTPSPAPVAGPSAAPPPAAALATAPPSPQPWVAPAPPAMQRHSTGMFVGGIVMLSFIPVALLTALVADSEQKACNGGTFVTSTGLYTQGTNCGAYDKTIYGSLVVGLGLMGGGIPLVIIGGKKEPVGTVQVTPWTTRNAGGLALHVDL